VDPFAVVLLGGLAALILAIWLLGRYYPGSGLEQVGLKSGREIAETREALDAEDLDQMLVAHNARRRARGEAELTVTDLELRVMQDLDEQRRRRAQYAAERELDELLEATNARRRARGLPERTRWPASSAAAGTRCAGRLETPVTALTSRRPAPKPSWATPTAWQRWWQPWSMWQ
jgi:hypothetical protein